MKILIVEDEAILAQRIQRLVSQILENTSLQIRVEHSLEAAKMYLKTNAIDLLFLDLNLNGEDGFELLRGSLKAPFSTVIISAYKESAIDAFEYGVIDFVRKPLTLERLDKAVKRVLQREKTQKDQYLSIKLINSILPLPISDIIYIQGAGIYSKIFTRSYETILHDKSLDKLEGLLPGSFCRIHKSFIVELSSIKKIHIFIGSRYKAELSTGEHIPIGRTFYRTIKERLFA